MAGRHPLGGSGAADTCWTTVALLLLALAVFGGGTEGYLEELFEGDACRLQSGKTGVCRRAEACSWLRTALTRNQQTIVNCGFDGNVAIVCCPSGDGSVKNATLKLAVQMCDNSDGLTFHILSGVRALKGEVPFIAAIGYRNENPEPGEAPYKWGCGASLIEARFLLTAAHCVESREFGRPQIIRMGALNLLADPSQDVQDRTVKNVIVHPNYKSNRKYDDIALIEVDKPFLSYDALNPVCLSTNFEETAPSQVLLAAGWGQTETAASSADALFIANLSYVPNDECGKQFEAAFGSYGSKKGLGNGIVRSQYCAVGVQVSEVERSDTCQGDSGGPLYYIGERNGVQKYFQVGVTSFGLNCGSGVPSVYTRVTHYLDWILSKVAPDEVTES